MKRGLLRGATLALSLVAMLPSGAHADCVVFLHGLGRTSHSLDKMAQAFAARGFKVANVDYPSRHHAVAELAEIAVAEGIERCDARGADTIHFVAHSLGAILVRYYLAHNALPNLGRVVMLAPPNQGSEVVDKLGRLPGFSLMIGPAGKQLGTQPSGIPAQLGPVHYPVGVIAGTRSINPLLSSLLPNPDDGKVAVARTKVEGMTDFITLPASHTFIMRRERTIAQALAFIESGAFLRDAH